MQSIEMQSDMSPGMAARRTALWVLTITDGSACQRISAGMAARVITGSAN